MLPCIGKHATACSLLFFSQRRYFPIDRIVGLQYLLQWNMTPYFHKVMQYIFALKTYDVFGAEKKWFSSFSN